MRDKHIKLLGTTLFMAVLAAGCAGAEMPVEESEVPAAVIAPATEITQLAEGFSAVRYDGDYGWDSFLEQGGASSDDGVIRFLARRLNLGQLDLRWQNTGFGCSTLAVKNESGQALFGRNFDWQNCQAMVVLSAPESEYASISTVNMDFIGAGYGGSLDGLPQEVRTALSLYAPLDGMNEKGLCVSVNMIQDSAVIDQDTEKPDLTTTTAIRLLLNRAAGVDEAISLLEQYDMHASMGMMVHFALADKSGRSAVVEYVGDKMVVTDTPVVTNFYLAPGKKYGVGTAQSHTRFDLLMNRIKGAKSLSEADVRDALDSVSKKNFGEFESTEWSIVFNQSSGVAQYYHRENYDKPYSFSVKTGNSNQ